MSTEPKISNSEDTKQRYDVALLGEETGGALAFRAQDIVPNQGTPLHRHFDQDETFHIVKGEFRFIVGEEEIFAYNGTTLFVPRGTSHSLLNIGRDTGKLISVLTPGIHDGFVLNIPQAEQSGASNEELDKLASQFGAEILGPKQIYPK